MLRLFSTGSICTPAMPPAPFMVAIFVLMMVLSAGRPVGINIPAADDFVSWCMAAMAFLGLAHTFRPGEMIRVGLLIDKLPERTRHWFELGALSSAPASSASSPITR